MVERSIVTCFSEMDKSTYELPSLLGEKLKFTLLKGIKISIKMHKVPIFHPFSELGKILKSVYCSKFENPNFPSLS